MRAYIHHITAKETAGAHLYVVVRATPDDRIRAARAVLTTSQTYNPQRAFPAFADEGRERRNHRGPVSRFHTQLL